MKKVTGLGGIFFKCNDPQKMRNWYAKNLGLNNGDHGTCFEWRQADDKAKKGFTVWSLFPCDTQYFEPSKKDFMINYRVVNIEKLVDQLKKDGVTLIDEIRPYEYGKFVHILDPEGNSIELWEPNDEKYDKIAGVRTK
jgi:predicted enzyme related to lactoylglutathione lyase